ncbi:MAG: PilN domain-containing protein [Bradyrhizobium sp.]
MWTELKELFAIWITAVAAAVEALLARLAPRRRVRLQEIAPDRFTASLAVPTKESMLQPVSFGLVQGRAHPQLPQPWQAALRGSQIEVSMLPDQVLFRELDFPKQATPFLDGMVRAQIDRLAPWPVSDVVYGLTEPEPVANDRIALMLAATSKAKIEPLIDLATDVGAGSVSGLVALPGASTGTVRLFALRLSGSGTAAFDMPLLLRRSMLGAGLAAAAALLIASYLGGTLDLRQQELQQQLTQRRAALRLNQGTSSAETLLARRKQTSPSSVMVLESLSRTLPDTTYVTELRIEADKLQVVGLSRDAPSLIRLLEQSPQFNRATFFAPTTRSPEEPGERFHIEAHVTPYFGSGS